jgi:copper transport protein
VTESTYAVLLAIVRVADYAGFVLLAGTLMFLSIVWPQGRRDRRLVRIVVFGIVLTAIGTIADPLVQAAKYDVGVLDAVGRLYAAAALIRLAVAVAVLMYLPDIVARDIHRWRTGVALTAVLLLEASMIVQSDAIDGPWAPLKVIAATGHLTAVAVWLGGLVALATMLISGDRLAELQAILPSFRGLSMLSVLILLVTGALHAVVQAGGVDPLFGSRYGEALGMKAVILVLMLVIGDRSRRHAGSPDYRPLNEFSRTMVPVAARPVTIAIGVEVALAAGALAATAIAVWYAP